MPFHFHKRITLVPKLLHLNVGPHGWSLTLGGRRAHLTRDSHGRHGMAVRLPGGFVWRRRVRRRR
ncbi:DUF4236 domain-containing protein [Streptomyces clavuligerus]|uniref:DUF4236 domain-containing protein n=1 Tax=Streptomyces clavuligerus TaxID=1901 RepID=B5H1K3_STRCL|nr:DUF4236 domain-containing protein [Streptomyces clavuligerus]ANW17535.1 hypothetical protein BB341_04485 [Streptomyces clavuligerus]AXU12080.1 DUF4236 domain-containing protein [Streptomyces clavuligerus]EDY52449.1 hypothetical protein SSCG_05504 [Streptomyces clavuligerus]EFG09962.1 Hypothetical protein SCLAV_4889 [Streptomyces clavuligerus]MBY6301942.1 DUF4236 domain-containing protein [Streptomyces clavuligerus]